MTTLVAKRFFHASPTVFKVGETLLPPSVTGTVPNYSLGRPATRVFMALTVGEAEEWAVHLKHLSRHHAVQPEVFIYEVSPAGRVHSKWLADMEVTEYHAASATVLARVSSV